MTLTKLWDEFWEATGIEIFSQRLAEPNENETILDIPGYRQSRSFTCGFTSGLMVAHAINPKISITKFYYACNPHMDYGTSTNKLTLALRQFGIRVSKKKCMTFASIIESIDNGQPILTTIKKGKDEHWVVLYGFNAIKKRVFLAGNNFPWLPIDTSLAWPELRGLVPARADWLICGDL